MSVLMKTKHLFGRKIGPHTMGPETTPSSTGAITGRKSGRFPVLLQTQKIGLVGLLGIGNGIAGKLPAGSANDIQRGKGHGWLFDLRCSGARLINPRLARSAALSFSQADYTGTTIAAISYRSRFDGSVHTVMAESTLFGDRRKRCHR